MILFGLTSGILTLLMAGFGVTMLALRRPAQLHFLECVCLSWLFGTGVVSLLLWMAGAVMSGSILRAVVGLACLALAILGWRAAKANGLRVTFQKPANAVEWLLAIVIAAEIGLTVFLLSKNPLGWDGSFNWEAKARYAFLSGGAIPSAYYPSGSQVLGHPEYPLLIPFTELWLYLCMGEPNQFWVKAIFAIFYGAGVILLAMIGARLSGKRWAGGVAAALVFFIPWLTTQPAGIISGYVDFPLSVFYLAAIGYLLLSCSRFDPNCFRVAMIGLAILPWVKREGAILWLAGALCAAVIIWRNKERWTRLIALLPGVAVMMIWNGYLWAVRAPSTHDFVKATLPTLWANRGRILPILQFAWREVTYINYWSFFWLLVGAALVQQLARRRDTRLLILAMALVMPVTLYCCSYIFSSWPDYQMHFRYSLFRLLLHVAMVGWLAVTLALPSRTNEL